MIKSVRFHNLRNLADTRWIDIRQISLLVGTNSSGKSTFLRAFPLLKQSIAGRTRGPILWYGPLVDFGSFDDAVHISSDGEKAKRIGFGFRLKIPHEGSQAVQIDATLWVKESTKGSTETDYVEIRAFGSVVRFNFEPNDKVRNIQIDDEDFPLEEEYSTVIATGGLFPKMYRGLGHQWESDYYAYYYHRHPRQMPMVKPLIHRIGQLVHGRTSEITKWQIARKIHILDGQDAKEAMLSVKQAPKTWYRYVRSSRKDSQTIAALKRAWIFSRLPMVLEQVDRAVSSFLASTSYTKPVRATAERYYRKQDLSVQDIDPEGSNTAMFLDSLPRSDSSRFHNWTGELFGIEFRTHSKEGHVAIRLVESEGGRSLNLADVGFGYSQLLPILVQVWNAKYRQQRRTLLRGQAYRPILIEQPELHLHPRMQAKIAEVLALGTKKSESQVAQPIFIVETHSEHLISAIGDLIIRKDLKAKEVQVIVFEGGEFAESATIERVTFTSNGELVNWPIGFFSP